MTKLPDGRVEKQAGGVSCFGASKAEWPLQGGCTWRGAWALMPALQAASFYTYLAGMNGRPTGAPHWRKTSWSSKR